MGSVASDRVCRGACAAAAKCRTARRACVGREWARLLLNRKPSGPVHNDDKSDVLDDRHVPAKIEETLKVGYFCYRGRR